MVSCAPAQDIKRVVITDSSVITTQLFSYFDRDSQRIFVGKIVEERLNGKNIVHQKCYGTNLHNDTSTISSDGYTDTTLHFQIGMCKIYDTLGNPKLIIDYDKRMWHPVDTSRYHNYGLLNRAKIKAHSILTTIFSADFCKEHLKWSIFRSVWFDKYYDSEPSLTFEWTTENTSQYSPTEFLLRYDLVWDNRVYEAAITLLLDENFNVLKTHGWNENWITNNSGLEDLKDDQTRNFCITQQSAIALAKQHGLQTSDSIKCFAILRGEKASAKSEIFNTRWRVYVMQKTNMPVIFEKETLNEKASTFAIVYYKVWVFDPWKGSFLLEKTMYQTYEHHSFMLDISGYKDLTLSSRMQLLKEHRGWHRRK